MRTTVLALGALVGLSGTALAQDDAGQARGGADGGAGIRSGHITSTGETVPNPGASQGAGTTSMDRGIQQRDNAIDSGICKGC